MRKEEGGGGQVLGRRVQEKGEGGGVEGQDAAVGRHPSALPGDQVQVWLLLRLQGERLQETARQLWVPWHIVGRE